MWGVAYSLNINLRQNNSKMRYFKRCPKIIVKLDCSADPTVMPSSMFVIYQIHIIPCSTLHIWLVDPLSSSQSFRTEEHDRFLNLG